MRCYQGCHLEGAPLYAVDGYAYCHDCAAKAVMKKAQAEFCQAHGTQPIWKELAFAALAIKQSGLNPDIVFVGQPRSVRNKILEAFAETD
ncbi:MAG: hypothetical protein JRG69_03515 [Deltaproteobacteria bacterium]|nr:hypothetical protein [Deltaproteobacteria bacterium]